MQRLLIIGAGGFGREVHGIVVAIDRQQPTWDFEGFLDDGTPDEQVLARIGAKVIGTTATLDAHRGSSFVVAVADPSARRALASAAQQAGLSAATLVHPAATFGMDVSIGRGSIICSHVSVTTNVRIGEHVHLDQNVAVGHDTLLGDFSRVNPGATVSGNVTIGEGATVGTNAAIVQGVRVGALCTVGAGAVVLGQVEDGQTVVGVPARPTANRVTYP